MKHPTDAMVWEGIYTDLRHFGTIQWWCFIPGMGLKDHIPSYSHSGDCIIQYSISVGKTMPFLPPLGMVNMPPIKMVTGGLFIVVLTTVVTILVRFYFFWGEGGGGYYVSRSL